jgi:hypothetical protein
VGATGGGLDATGGGAGALEAGPATSGVPRAQPAENATTSTAHASLFKESLIGIPTFETSVWSAPFRTERDHPETSIPRPHFDLSVTHADLEAWLGERRGSLQDTAVVECEARTMPGTADAPGVDVPLRERAAEVRTAIGERIDAIGLSNQHNRDTPNIETPGHRLYQFSFRKDGDEVLPLDARSVIDTDALAIDEMPTEVRGRQRDAQSGVRGGPSGSPRAPQPKEERGRVKAGGRDVEEPMEETNATLSRCGVLPVGDACHRGADGANQSDADRSVGGSVGRAIAARQIERSGHRPGSERDIRENGMERMTQPRPVEEITNAPTRGSTGFICGNDGSLEPLGDRLQPRLVFHTSNSSLT